MPGTLDVGNTIINNVIKFLSSKWRQNGEVGKFGRSSLIGDDMGRSIMKGRRRDNGVF